jgi:hypothetical protein
LLNALQAEAAHPPEVREAPAPLPVPQVAAPAPEEPIEPEPRRNPCEIAPAQRAGEPEPNLPGRPSIDAAAPGPAADQSTPPAELPTRPQKPIEPETRSIPGGALPPAADDANRDPPVRSDPGEGKRERAAAAARRTV